MSQGVQKALRSFVAAGYQVDRDAFEFLALIGESDQLETLTANTLTYLTNMRLPQPVVTRTLLEDTAVAMGMASPRTRPSVSPNVMAVATPLAKQTSSQLDILNDPSKTIGSAGTVEDFGKYFRHRFDRLRSILEERGDARGAGDIDSALRAPQGTEVRFICMVTNKRTRQTHILLSVEDEESQASLLVQTQQREAYQAAQSVPLDQVVYIEARRGRGDFLLCDRLVLPDIPDRRGAKSREPVCVAMVSDVHVGSKTFMTDVFERVVLWLNGRIGNSRQRELASRVKYVIVAGDLVDGVGIYPNQEAELAIPDVYSQYRFAAQYVEQVPDYIDVILIPGNHDATRQSLPQPEVPKEFADPVYQARKVWSLGNPAEVSLHGIRFLLYHGRSLDDIIASTPGMTFDAPEAGMEFLLRCRHLAPQYGARTSIAPENDDRLVIQNAPDVFHAGHIHVNGERRYRGTMIVNSGAWQRQTDYQRRMGLQPTPGLLPVIDLQRMEVTRVDFNTV